MYLHVVILSMVGCATLPEPQHQEAPNVTATVYKSVGQPFYQLSSPLATFLSVVATRIHDLSHLVRSPHLPKSSLSGSKSSLVEGQFT